MGKRNRAGSPVDAAEQDRGVGQNAQIMVPNILIMNHSSDFSRLSFQGWM